MTNARLITLAVALVGFSAIVALMQRQTPPVTQAAEAKIELKENSERLPQSVTIAPSPTPKPNPKPQPATQASSTDANANARLDNRSAIVSQEAARIQKMFEATLHAVPGEFIVTNKVRDPNGSSKLIMGTQDGTILTEYYNDALLRATDISMPNGVHAVVYYSDDGGVRSYTVEREKKTYQVKYFRNGEIEELTVPEGAGHRLRVWDETTALVENKFVEP